MVFPGGSADKKGNYYEQLWTVRCILQVLRSEYETIKLEPLGQEGEGVEFVLKKGNILEYHQVKRQHPEGSWTLARLSQKNILQHFWRKLRNTNARCVFVSMSDAQSLRELILRAKQLQTWSYFQEHGLASSVRNQDFEELCRYLDVDELHRLDVFEALKRIEIRTSDESTLQEANNTAIERIFDFGTQEAKTVADVIGQFLYSQLHRNLTKTDILKYLQNQRVVLSVQEVTNLKAEVVQSYLQNLIGSLEKRIGVMQYIELKTLAHASSFATPSLDWGPDFSLIRGQNDEQIVSLTEVREPLDDIHEAVERYPKFVLVGVPGAGKTTTLRRLALQTARRCFENLGKYQANPIPLYVSLPAWRNDESSIEDFIRAQFSTWKFNADVIELLNSGLAILYLDGLNEMGQSGAAKALQVSQWIHGRDERDLDSISAFPPQRVIVTCRKDVYFGLSGFDLKIPVIETEELDDQRIREFATNYLGQNAEDFVDRVLPKNNKSSSLLPLARNPYRLAILVLLHQESPSGELPQNTGRLFQQMVKQLWATEEERRATLTVKYADMEKALARLAFVMIDAGMPTSVTHNYALLFIDSDEILDAVRNVLLVVETDGVSFFHQSMQEYFAAIALQEVGIEHIMLSRDNVISTSNSSLSTSWIDMFMKDVPAGEFELSDKWNQVVIALCGIVQKPAQLIREIARLNPFLAQSCINSGIEVSDLNLIPNYLEALRNANVNIVGTAINALGQYGDESVARHLIPFLSHRDENIVYATTQALVLLGLKGIDVLVEQLSVGSQEEKHTAARILIRFDSDVATYLLDILPHVDELTQQYIYLIIGNYDNKEIMDTLCEALESQNLFVRAQALSSLGRISNPRALDQIKIMLSVQSVDDRINAVKALGNAKTKNEEFVVKTLANHLHTESNTDVLLGIIGVLAEIKTPLSINALGILMRDKRWIVHKAAYDALEGLKTRKSRELTKIFRDLRTQYNQRRTEALSRIYDSFGVLGLIFALKHHYKNPNVHWDIARFISSLSESDMLDVINALSDDEFGVRHKVVAAFGFRGDPKFAEILLPFLSDENVSVRGETVQTLGKLKFAGAVETIKVLLNDVATVYANSPNRVCDYVIYALREIGTEEALAIIDEWQEPNNGNL